MPKGRIKLNPSLEGDHLEGSSLRSVMLESGSPDALARMQPTQFLTSPPVKAVSVQWLRKGTADSRRTEKHIFSEGGARA